jgi:hypothetical protein
MGVQDRIIKTTSHDQWEILANIIKLYIPAGHFDLDPTYSKGNFYRNGVPEPVWKADLNPQTDDTIKADAATISTNMLPGCHGGLRSIIFDPPFIAAMPRKGKEKDGIIRARFGYFKNIPELWEWYGKCIINFYSLLTDGGVLVFKCQDTIDSSKQYLSHVEVVNMALAVGFYPRDLFVLLAKNRIIGKTHRKQQHARKYHSYFLVFEKRKCRVPYLVATPR